MKFEFENLGLLDHATLDLADLTLICGENNTGKTYATYAVYGFLRSWRNLLPLVLGSEIKAIAKAQGAYKFDLNEMFHGRINDYLAKLGAQYISQLPRVFASNKDFFEGVHVLISVDSEQSFEDIAFQRNIKDGPAGKVLATLSKELGSPVLELLVADDAWLESPFSGLTQFVADAIAEIVFAPLLPDAHISSAERTGAAIFRRELDMARTRMIEALSTIDSKELKKNPFRLLEQMDAGYAWPVQDNVDFVRQLEDIDKQTGELAAQTPEVLSAFDAIIGGTYKVIKDQGLVYQPKGGKPRFSMNESSSCIRALLDVGFYLRCKAKPGDLFIIDEPELNLHPRNQRAFARLVARMVNAGVRVFITTHSDYLVKEFNTLIMLAQGTPHTKAMQETYGYSDEELLVPRSVKLYMTGTELRPSTVKGKRATRINTLKPANIYPDRGIEVSTFDSTIEEMNAIQSEILYGGDL